MLHLSPRTLQRVAAECYGRKLDEKFARAVSQRIEGIVRDLNLVVSESAEWLGDPAFSLSPELRE